MSATHYTGWDIGGAHLKVARLNSRGALTGLCQFATPLWQGIDTLSAAVGRVLETTPPGECIHTLTMTGELVDVFPGRREGVIRLLEYMLPRLGRAARVYIYAGRQGLIAPGRAVDCHAEVASANWHASATLAARSLDSGILIDAGTTTTDIIPFRERRVHSRGYSDQERLQSGELVYTGITRTPVMAVVRRLPYRGVWQSIAAEHFATMADVYRITGELDEGSDLLPAADGGGKTRYDSVKRLARMLGADYDGKQSMQPWLEVAAYIAARQLEKTARAFERIRALHRGTLSDKIAAAGAGRFIIEKLAKKYDCEVVNFEDLLPSSERKLQRIDNCATAAAVAGLTWLAVNS